MIQRIQTIWLLLATLFGAGLFFTDLYRADIVTNGIAAVEHIRVNDHYPSLIVALVMTLMPFFAIFMFKNRTKQRTMVLFGMFVAIAFLAFTLFRVSNFNQGTSAPANGTYWIGSVLPVLSLIFQIMALRGIRRDEKLVKSLDRLR